MMENVIKQLTWQSDGLIPAIVQDYETKQVLMLAYMNKQSLAKTIETKETWFFSRSRNELWHKGATSGNRQTVKQILYDCDGDSLLIFVKPKGPACHTGETSCFFNSALSASDEPTELIIEKLTKRIKKRFDQPTDGSYTTYLFNEGIDKILKKIGEEASEIIIAAKNDDDDELIWEIADFIYHTLVLMQVKNITMEQIYKELAKRFGDKEGETT
ncbi:MAG TPA: bifunctional phosphoribosyl-AMP cyclohydrolase/phosphoribosyl-ATP diphosphatase HisIE [Bacillota bacterium]|nr:bifunctional phosphoribosyl-AMP cyclohydrolase/phosphoribosyl-ATP diphosphatase HisIE [Bacillota bacterium]